MILTERTSVLEISPAEAVVITCHDDPAFLDAFPGTPHALRCRVARDELLLVGTRTDAAALMSHVASAQQSAGSRGIAMDVSDAWAIWTVSGHGTSQVLARLSENPMPESRAAVVQGHFARVPSKVFLVGDIAHIMVPSPVGHHVLRRLLEASGGDLSPRVLEPRALTIESVSLRIGLGEQPVEARAR